MSRTALTVCTLANAQGLFFCNSTGIWPASSQSQQTGAQGLWHRALTPSNDTSNDGYGEVDPQRQRAAVGGRREKAALSSRCKPTRQPLQAEATGAGVEVAKCLKPSYRLVTNYGDSASVQAAT